MAKKTTSSRTAPAAEGLMQHTHYRYLTWTLEIELEGFLRLRLVQPPPFAVRAGINPPHCSSP